MPKALPRGLHPLRPTNDVGMAQLSMHRHALPRLHAYDACVYVLKPFVLPPSLAATGRSFVRRHRRRVELGYVFCEGEVEWHTAHVVQIPIACTFAGVMAGTLGVGGAMVMQPLMLELGLRPDVRRPFPSMMRPILTEICLCHACSGHLRVWRVMTVSSRHVDA